MFPLANLTSTPSWAPKKTYWIVDGCSSPRLLKLRWGAAREMKESGNRPWALSCTMPCPKDGCTLRIQAPYGEKLTWLIVYRFQLEAELWTAWRMACMRSARFEWTGVREG
jgi:hypothetical protein